MREEVFLLLLWRGLIYSKGARGPQSTAPEGRGGGAPPPSSNRDHRNRLRCTCRRSRRSYARNLGRTGVFFGLGGYYISRVRAEHASAPLRSRTRTTHWWQPPASALQEGQEREQEVPHNTKHLPLFSRGGLGASWSQPSGLAPVSV
jgi:hypothetical protein